MVNVETNIKNKVQRDVYRYIGQNITRIDAREKATAAIKYIDDIDTRGMLHIKLLLSPYANAFVKTIDTKETELVSGVVKVYSWFNSPKIPYNSAIFYPGQTDVEDEILFSNHVKYVGDRVAAVVAESEDAAEEGVSKLKVQYDELVPVVDPIKALRDNDVAKEYLEVNLSCGKLDEIECNAADFLTVEDEVHTQKIHHAALEPHACIAYTEPGGIVTVLSPCQLIFGVRYIVSKVLDCPLNKVRVIKVPMGGTFGGKQEVILEPICAYVAKDLGRPVKLSLSRRETILTTRTRAATIGKVKTMVSKNGSFIGREVDVITDAGAYTTGAHRVTTAMGKKVFRLYRIPNQTFRGMTVCTNTTPSGACRGYGSPQIHVITEINIDHIARELKLDPVELRLKNLVMPFDDDLSGGPNLGNARIVECVNRGAEAFRWKERFSFVPQRGRFRHGVGMACSTHSNGYAGSIYPDFTAMNMRLTEDGAVLVNAGLHELGNGTLTVIAQIVAEVLDVDIGKVVVSEGDTMHSPYDVGCVASRVTYVCGNCAKKLAEEIREKFRALASMVLKVPLNEITLRDGKVIVQSDQDRVFSYGKIVSEIGRALQEEVGGYLSYRSVANPGSYAAHFAEVEVDTLTGLVTVTDYLAVHDVGKAINPKLVEGQIYGGVQMGIGMALFEEVAYDLQGRPRNASFSRYIIANAPEMPKVRVMLVEDEEPSGPFGAKSVGEIATVPVAAAVVNAVNWALGTRLAHLPLNPTKILSSIEKHERGEEK